MRKEKIVGIDLGTTNSVLSVMEGGKPVVVYNSEGKRITPSVVSFSKEGNKVGDLAKRKAIVNPKKTIFSSKVLIGKSYEKLIEKIKNLPFLVEKGQNNTPLIRIEDRQYTPQEIAAMILQKLKSAAKDHLGEEVKKAVITVPAYFDDAQRQATKEAGQIAGLEVVRIINEPTAAALAYGIDKKEKESTIIVYDLGGGTFDVTILHMGDGVFEVKSTNGDTSLGGDDFDEKIIDYIIEEFKKEEGIDLRKDPTALQRLKESAEKAKIELSNLTSTEINLPFITSSQGEPKHLHLTLSRSKFEELCYELVERTLAPCKAAMQDASCSQSDIDEVILVGGSTRIPIIQEKVAKLFGKEPSKGVNPDEVVAKGAAIQAGILAGDVDDVVLLDVTPLSLGIETMGGVMTKLIESNTTIPTKKSQDFSTAENNQSKVDIHVLQGERPLAKDCKTLGRFILDGIPPAPRGMPQIEVTFDIDANGIVSVSAKDKSTGKEQNIKIEASSNLSKEEIERMRQEAIKHEEEDKKEREKVDKVNKADSLIFQVEKQLKEDKGKISEEHRTQLTSQVADLKKAHEAKNMEEIDKHMTVLEKTFQTVAMELYTKAAQEAQKEGKSTEHKAKEQKLDPAQEHKVQEAEFEEVKE